MEPDGTFSITTGGGDCILLATAWYTFVPVFVDYGKINRKKAPKPPKLVILRLLLLIAI